MSKFICERALRQFACWKHIPAVRGQNETERQPYRVQQTVSEPATRARRIMLGHLANSAPLSAPILLAHSTYSAPILLGSADTMSSRNIQYDLRHNSDGY